MGSISEDERSIDIYKKRILEEEANIKKRQKTIQGLKKFNSIEGIKKCQEENKISENHIDTLQTAINDIQNRIDNDSIAK